MASFQKAHAYRNDRTQAALVPGEYRPDEVSVEGDPAEVFLAEERLHPSLDDIFRELDTAHAGDFELERDQSAPVDREWM